MSLQFIMGPSGSGKSHYLYHNFIEQSNLHPEQQFILLVPDQYNMQAQKDYIQASPKKGLLNVEILSFGRLAHRILEENGGMDKVILDEVGKSFVLRKVVENCMPNLKIISGQIKKVGYIEELKSAISELAQYGIHPEDMDEILARMEEGSSLFYKMRDLQLIYTEFQAYMQGKYLTGEERMDLLCEVVSQSRLLKNSVIALDGFTGFTPIQKKLIRRLLNVSEKMLVSVAMSERENPFVYKHPYQLFCLSKQTVTSLMDIAREEDVVIEEPVYLYDNPTYRFRENPAMAFLSKHLFVAGDAKFDKEQESIRIVGAKTPREEVEEIARQIRRMVRKDGYRYRDIALVSPAMDAYGYLIDEVFADYNIPVFMDSKRSILLNSFVEYLRSLLDMTEQNFTYEGVFRYLRTGMTRFSMDEVDRLENYVRATGIRGYKRWSEEWYCTTRMVQEPELEELNALRSQFVEDIDTTVEVLKRRNKTVLDITTALHTLFIKNGLQQKVKEYEVYFANEGKAKLAKEYAQIYRIVMDLFDQLVTLLGEEKISLREYCTLLDAGLSYAKVGTIPPTLDSVVVGDITRSRLPEVKSLFLMGMNDAYIPGNAEQGGFISDYDRQQMSQLDVQLAPTAKEKTYIQKFYLYLVMSKPSEHLNISYSKVSSEGKAMRPSYVIGDLKKMYPYLKERQVDLQEKEWTGKGGMQYLVRGLQKRQKGISEEWKEVLRWYKQEPKWREKAEQILKAAYYHKPEDQLTEEVARRLYGSILRNSVSRLEKFMSCAYAHFLSYGLQLQEREEASFRAMDFGNVFHKALELFSRKLNEKGYTWTNVPEELRGELIEESVDESTLEFQGSMLFESARENYAIARIRRMLYRTVWALTYQLEQGDFAPDGYEVRFKRSFPLFEDCSMQLGGVIDRMDVCIEEEKVYVKIIDYKTGSKEFDISSLYHGLQMQLITYMTVAMEMQKDRWPDKEIIPSGIMYYQISDPLVEDREDPQKEKEEILKNLRPNGLLNNQMENIYHLDREIGSSSLVVPAGKTKSGTLTKHTKAISGVQWKKLMNYSKKQLHTIGTKIMQGDIQISPYMQKENVGCRTCPYITICKFDEKIPGYQYRDLETMSTEEVLEAIGEEEETWESNSQQSNKK